MSQNESKISSISRQKVLAEANADIGDIVEIFLSNNKFKGILIPNQNSKDKNIITLKLENGYNLGLDIKKIEKLQLLKKGGVDKPNIQLDISNSSNSLKKLKNPKKSENLASSVSSESETDRKSQNLLISVISTGGTIASYIDYRTGAVHAAKSAQDLEYSAPELTNLAQIDARILFSELSENITPWHWIALSAEINKIFQKTMKGDPYKGIIIPHGTDTMAYTASALSFILGPELPLPVLLVGSQRSSDRPSSDANQNLLAAAKLALKSDIGEVVVLMHSSTSDNSISIHRGTKVRKLHTSRRDAFQTINGQQLGEIDLITDSINLQPNYRRVCKSDIKSKTKPQLNDRVCLLQIYPSLSIDQFEIFLENNDGIVLAGTGLGHAPSRLLECVRSGIKDGKHIVMTSQCLFGRVNLNVYSTGRDYLNAGVISGKDMLPETAYIKLMWVLGQTNDAGEVKRMMQTNYVGEITERTEFEAFY
jgi:glutamyl-tRNA(Gln) amidotransferase subunit D